jgi:hypothetical protein
VAAPQRSSRTFLAGEMTGCCGPGRSSQAVVVLLLQSTWTVSGPGGLHPGAATRTGLEVEATRSTGPMVSLRECVVRARPTTDLPRNASVAAAVTREPMDAPARGGIRGVHATDLHSSPPP